MKSRIWDKNVDRLMVEEHWYGPIETSGLLEESGIIETLGSAVPRVVSVLPGEILCAVEVSVLEDDTEVACRAANPVDADKRFN